MIIDVVQADPKGVVAAKVNYMTTVQLRIPTFDIHVFNLHVILATVLGGIVTCSATVTHNTLLTESNVPPNLIFTYSLPIVKISLARWAEAPTLVKKFRSISSSIGAT